MQKEHIEQHSDVLPEDGAKARDEDEGEEPPDLPLPDERRIEHEIIQDARMIHRGGVELVEDEDEQIEAHEDAPQPMNGEVSKTSFSAVEPIHRTVQPPALPMRKQGRDRSQAFFP